MFTIVVDNDIILHLIQAHHHHDLFKIIDNNRIYFEKYLGSMDKDVNATRQNCLMSKRVFGTHGDVVTMIAYKGEPAGLISLRDRTGGTVSGAEIGYWISKSFEGNGIITRSAKTMTDYAFSHLDVERVFLGIAPDNTRSLAVAERLGFTHEGTIRHNVQIDDIWVDHGIYSMLKSEWNQSQHPHILRFQVSDTVDMRLIEKCHAQTLFQLCDINREHLESFLPWIDDTNEVADTMGFINGALTQYGDNNGWQAGIWHDDQLVGMIGYLFWDVDSQQTEIGYWLSESATGHGIMTHCTRELTRYAFETLKLNRVVIRCADTNIKSAGVAERLGYTLEGTQRQGIRLRDQFVDCRVYSLLAEEWQAL